MTWPLRYVVAALLLAGGVKVAGPSGAEAGKVLGLFQFPGHSHFVMFERLLKELAARGHQVTVASHFPQKTPLANYTDLSLKGSVPSMLGGFTVQEMLTYDLPAMATFLFEVNSEMCETVMQHSNMQRLLRSEESFDLVLLEIFGADCCYGFAWKFGAPVVAMTSGARMPWGQFRVGNPETPATFPVAHTPYTAPMGFWERLGNTGAWLYYNLRERLTAHPAVSEINRKYFGPDVPPLDDLLYNTSAIFLNSHFSLNGALPAVPAVVEVGGLHIDPSDTQLPQALGHWLDGASAAGAVYLSFGSLARVEEMPLPQLRAMVSVLGSLPQRVLWKCQGSTATQRLGHELPPNIFTENWIPQAAVLAHQNVKAFVAHGGLMGTQEAVFWGIPMLVVPLFADQHQNANNLVERGMARKIFFNDITEQQFREALLPLLNDPSYSENARRLSALFRDRPRPPLQEAVFWSEYVMRHAGAPHLRSAAVRLRWWQHWLLDVAAAALAALAAILAAALLLFRLLCRVLCRRERRDKVKRS